VIDRQQESDDMSTPDSEFMPLDIPVGSVSPRRIFLDISPGTTRATMVAATEGVTRFVASAHGEPGPREDQARTALQWLATQCGYPVTADMVDFALIRGKPLRVGLVGACGPEDKTAIENAERSGFAHIAEVPGTPPRNAGRRPEWVRPILDALIRGEYDVLMIATQPGALPTWAAQLLNALHASPLHQTREVIVIASDASLAPAIPSGACLLVRDASRPPRLAAALTAIRGRRVSAGSAPTASVLSHISALSSGLTFAARALRETVVYVDVSAGTTVLIARNSGIDILVDAEVDCAAGAAALLDHYGAEQIARWIPFPIDPPALRRWAVRRVSRPAAIPVETTDRAGFARAALSGLIAKAAVPIADAARCVIGPAVLAWSTPVDAMCLVADVLRGVRFANLATDPDDLLPIIGALAAHDPESAHSLLTHDALSDVGAMLILPENEQRKESPVVAIIQDSDRATRTTISANALTRIPVPSRGSLRMIHRDGREETVPVAGRSGDLFVDTRTRPLSSIASPGPPRGSVSARLKPALMSEEAPHD